MSADTKLLTLAELAEESGLPIATLYTLCAPRGDLAVIRTSTGPGKKRATRGRILVKRSDWEAWQQRHRTGPAAAETPRPRGRADVSDLPGADRYAH